MQYALFDVGTEQQVLTGSVGRQHDQLRDLSHYIADQSFEKLTGIKGAFSPRCSMSPPSVSRSTTPATPCSARLRRRPPGDPAAVARAHRVAALSPDGRRIAYVSFEQKRPRIFIQYVDTGRREQITNLEGPEWALRHSPDGKPPGLRPVARRQPGNLRHGPWQRALRRLTNNLAIDTRTLLGQGRLYPVLHLTVAASRRSKAMNVNSGAVDRVTFIGNYNAPTRNSRPTRRPCNGPPPAGLHQLPDRRPGPPARQSAGAVEHHSGRFATVAPQWHHKLTYATRQQAGAC